MWVRERERERKKESIWSGLFWSGRKEKLKDRDKTTRVVEKKEEKKYRNVWMKNKIKR